jgi:hypothetical protein
MGYLILLLLLLFFYYYYSHKNIIIKIYNSLELSKILKNDNYNYFTNMSDLNLEIRKIKNKDDYLNNISYNFYTLSFLEKIMLKNAIYKAQDILNTIKYPGFYSNKIKNIPWLIGFSKNKKYEFGFPHTRKNIIILNIDNIYDINLFKTLIHERIHIYQKLFPDDIQEFLNYFNFKKIGKLTDKDRVNPDTDEYLYQRNNIIYQCKINENSNIVKCTNKHPKYEHPYEFMAYKIVESI